MRIKKRSGQTSVEYTVVLILVIAALLGMQNYMKRSIQGRWKDSVDDLGDQYDPQTTVSDITHIMSSSTNTSIIAMQNATGYWTKRTDVSASAETVQGTTEVGAY